MVRPSNSLFDLSTSLEDDISSREKALKKVAEEASLLEREALKKWQCVFEVIKKLSRFVPMETWENFRSPVSFYCGDTPRILARKVLEFGKYTIFYDTCEGAYIYELKEAPSGSFFGFKKAPKREQECIVFMKESSSEYDKLYAVDVKELSVLAEVPQIYEELKQELLRKIDQQIHTSITNNELMKMADFKL